MLLLGGAVILGTVFGLVRLQRALLFPAPLAPRFEPPPIPGFEQWWNDTPAGPVEAWFLPAVDAVGVDAADEPRPAVLFAHGNGEVIDYWGQDLDLYRARGLHVVLAEYPGYGRSAGRTSEAAIAEAMRAVVERMRSDPRIDETRLVYHGRSLGGGAVGTLLATHPPAALLLESTFTSIPEVVPRIPSALIVDRFETRRALTRYEGPLLVVHGERDRVIPVAHGRRLAEHPGARLVVRPACGHNDLPHDARYWADVDALLAQLP